MAPDCRSPTPMNNRKIRSRTKVKWNRTGTPNTRNTPKVPGVGTGLGWSSDGMASGMLQQGLPTIVSNSRDPLVTGGPLHLVATADAVSVVAASTKVLTKAILTSV